MGAEDYIDFGEFYEHNEDWEREWKKAGRRSRGSLPDRARSIGPCRVVGESVKSIQCSFDAKPSIGISSYGSSSNTRWVPRSQIRGSDVDNNTISCNAKTGDTGNLWVSQWLNERW